MNRILYAGIVCGAVAFCGCFGPTRNIKVDRYYVGFDATNMVARSTLRLAVQQLDGRDLYHRDKMVVSAAEHTIDTYPNATWSQPPCDMVAQELVAHLSRRFQYAALLPCVYKIPTDAIIYAYIDAFDHTCRGGEWRAFIRVKYEIMSGDGQRLLHAAWFERTRSLSSAKLPEYVAAQNESVAELFAQIESDITTHVPPAGK